MSHSSSTLSGPTTIAPTPTLTPGPGTYSPAGGGPVKSVKNGLKGTSFAEGENALKPPPEQTPPPKPKKNAAKEDERLLEPKTHADPPPGDTGPTGGPDGDPPPLSEAAQTLRDEAYAALGRKVEGQKKGKRAVRRTSALDLIRRLGQADAVLRREVVAALDLDQSLSALFSFADIKAIWADEVAARSVLAILAVRDVAACRDDIRELTHVQIHLFKKGGPEVDLGTNRWEARIAWEMLMLLPDAEREQILTGGNTAQTAEKLADAKKDLKEAKAGGDKAEKKEARRKKREAKAEHKDQKKFNAGVKLAENNLSLEYKQSSRYDTYEGDAQKTLPEKIAEVEEKPDLEKPAEKPAEKTTEDTDRQALLALAIDPALWSDAPEARFRSVVRMVIQADEAAILAPLAKQHWATRGPILLPLGFAEDGTWKEHIEDKTATRAFGRAIAATVAITQTLHVVFGLAGKVRFRGEVDLGLLCKGFPGLTGLNLEPSKRPADPVTLLNYVLGGQSAAGAIMGLTGLTDAGELLKMLVEAEHAGIWLMSRIEAQGGVVEGADELRDALTKASDPDKGDRGKSGKGKKTKKEERETNKLLVETNGLTGERSLKVPALEIAAVSRRSGTSLLKTGQSSLYGIELVFKERTAFDQKRGVSVKVGAVSIGQLLKTDPEGMVAVDQITLGGMSLELESPETNPATWLEKLRDIVIHIGVRILEMMPLNWGTLVPKLVKFGSVAAKAYYEAIAMMGDTSKVTAKLGDVQALGFAQSGGGNLDELTVGASELTLEDERGVGFHKGALDDKSEKKLERERQRAIAEQKKTAEKIAKAEKKGKTARVEKLTERKAQAERVEARTSATLDDRKDLKQIDAELAKAEKELAGELTPTQREALEGRVAELKVERGLVQTRRLELDGHIGEIDVKGVDMGGTKIASVHVAKTELGFEKSSKTAEGKDGEPTDDERKLSMTNAHIEVTSLELAEDRRRDVVVKVQIRDLEDTLAKEDLDEATRKSTVSRLDALRLELQSLGPVVEEYELLRSRLRELDDEDRTRLLELRKQLSSPPTTKVEKVAIKDLSITASLTDGESKDGAKGELQAKIGSLEVDNVELNDDARHVMGGDTKVGKVDIKDLKFTAKADLEALLAGHASDGHGGGLSVKSAEVKAISLEGTRSEASRRLSENAATRARISAEMTRIRGKAKPASTDGAQLAALQAQLDQLTREDERLTREHLEAKPRLQALASAVDDRAKGLMSGGIDYARGASLTSTLKAAADAKKAIEQLDDKKLKARIGQYDAGIKALEAEIKEIEYVGLWHSWEPGSDKRQADEQTAVEAAIDERKALLERAREARKADLKKLADLGTERKEAEKIAAEAQRLADLYLELRDLSLAQGLVPIATENGLRVDDLSAYQMAMLARTAAEAGESTTIDRIHIQDLGLGADGTKTVDSEIKTLEDQDKGKDESKPLGEMNVAANTSGSMTIEGVKQGDKTLVGNLTVKDLGGGLTYDPKKRAVVLDKFGVGGLSLGNVDWASGIMAVRSPGTLGLDNVRVSGTIPLDAKEKSIESIHVDKVYSDELEFRYGDYLIAAEKGGSLGLKNVQLCHLNLSTFNVSMDAEEVSAEKLKVDLAQGMELTAGNLKTGLSVEALVANNKYDVMLGALSGDDVQFKMATMGLDVKIDEIRNGRGAVGVDLDKGNYTFDFDLAALGLGPMSMAMDGLDFGSKGGIDCTGVKVKGAMTTDEKGASHIKLERIAANHAKLDHVTVKMGEGKDQMRVDVQNGSMEDLALTDLDLDTMAMNLDLKKLDVKSLAVAMDGMDIHTSAYARTLNFKMFKNAKGVDVMEATFGGAYANGTVNMGMKDPKTSDGTLVGFDVDEAKGTLRMEGETTSFQGVAVKSAALPSVNWRGGSTTFTGTQIKASGVKADGYYKSYEKEVRGMMLPATDLVITRLHVDQVVGQALNYQDPARGMFVSPDPKQPGAQMTLSGFDIVDLKMLDGVLKNGAITLDKAVMGGQIELASSGLTLGGSIEAERLFCNIQDDGGMNFGATSMALKNVVGSKCFDNGDHLEFTAPHVFTSVVEGSYLSKYLESGLDGHKTDRTKLWVESVHIPEDIKADYYIKEWGDWKKGRSNEQIAKDRTHQKDEKTNAELEKERDQASLLQSLRPQLAELLANCNGDLAVGAQLAMGGSTLLSGMPRIRITDGLLDTQTLLASLGQTEVYGMKLIPTQDLRIYTVQEGGTYSVKVELAPALIGKIGLILALASPFMPLIGGALGAWLGNKYGAEVGANAMHALDKISPADKQAWLERANGREMGGLIGGGGGAGGGAIVGDLVAPVAWVGGLFIAAASRFVPRSWRTKEVAKGDSDELPPGFAAQEGDTVPLAVALAQFAKPEDLQKILALRTFADNEKAIATTAQRDAFTKATLDAMDSFLEIRCTLLEEISQIHKAMEAEKRKNEGPVGDPGMDPLLYEHLNDPRYQVKQDGYLKAMEDRRKELPFNVLFELSQHVKSTDRVVAEMKTSLQSLGVDIKEDAAASDFSLKVGPMVGFIELGRLGTQQSLEAMGHKVTLERMRVGINEQAGEGIFGGRLQLNQLGYESYSGSQKTSASLSYADIGFDGLADQYGFIPVMGKETKNPMSGKIKAGSKLEGLNLSFETDASAQVREKKAKG